MNNKTTIQLMTVTREKLAYLKLAKSYRNYNDLIKDMIIVYEQMEMKE